jgi:hypothetical protein
MKIPSAKAYERPLRDYLEFQFIYRETMQMPGERLSTQFPRSLLSPRQLRVSSSSKGFTSESDKEKGI